MEIIGQYEEYPEVIESGNWHDCIIANTLRYYNGRQLVIWGASPTGDKVKGRLENEYNIKNIILIDIDQQKQNWEGVFGCEILREHVNEMYVIIPLNYKKSIVDKLQEFGYRKNKDYYYFCDCIKEGGEGYYEDFHGNRIYGKHPNCEIMFYGFNSVVKIGKSPRILTSKIVVGNEVSIDIGDNIILNGTTMVIRDRAKLLINNRAHIESINFKILHDSNVNIGMSVLVKKNSNLLVHEEARLTIGDKTTIEENAWINVNQYSEVRIGKDSMISRDVVIMNNSRHSYFDVVTRENISSSIEKCRKSSVNIGNHVWIGFRSMIFEGADISDGSIIGANSFICNSVPNNCIAIGQPFRITRKDIAWARTDNSENIEECGLENINFTQDE